MSLISWLLRNIQSDPTDQLGLYCRDLFEICRDDYKVSCYFKNHSDGIVKEFKKLAVQNPEDALSHIIRIFTLAHETLSKGFEGDDVHKFFDQFEVPIKDAMMKVPRGLRAPLIEKLVDLVPNRQKFLLDNYSSIAPSLTLFNFPNFPQYPSKERPLNPNVLIDMEDEYAHKITTQYADVLISNFHDGTHSQYKALGYEDFIGRVIHHPHLVVVPELNESLKQVRQELLDVLVNKTFETVELSPDNKYKSERMRDIFRTACSLRANQKENSVCGVSDELGTRHLIRFNSEARGEQLYVLATHSNNVFLANSTLAGLRQVVLQSAFGGQGDILIMPSIKKLDELASTLQRQIA